MASSFVAGFLAAYTVFAILRLNSTLSRKKCEQLVTNHVALRLLKVVESSQARAIENKKKQLWCIDCNFTAFDF
ncbi:hypothetical protein OUZ56_016519 [Daphnia magna]|uniref:Secreted protein n=1 Tax=Daphnia magna TaxID=35525 RepID=A0ABR0AQS1_9CRUS|nr:hypothetical protein OUZ56_016519 [Daphnia magna]